jgi:CHAD domain-containing protein
LKETIEREAQKLDENAVCQPIDRLVGTRLHEYMNAREQFVSGNEAALHGMRIALKKLRYTVEAAQGFIGGWDDRALRKMQVAQKLMGETRDIEILMTQLEEWAVSQKQEAEAAGILRRLEKRRNSLIARIAKSSRAMDAAAPKHPGPIRETTRAAAEPSPSSHPAKNEAPGQAHSEASAGVSE